MEASCADCRAGICTWSVSRSPITSFGVRSRRRCRVVIVAYISTYRRLRLASPVTHGQSRPAHKTPSYIHGEQMSAPSTVTICAARSRCGDRVTVVCEESLMHDVWCQSLTQIRRQEFEAVHARRTRGQVWVVSAMMHGVGSEPRVNPITRSFVINRA